jgi:hypothetical protein
VRLVIEMRRLHILASALAVGFFAASALPAAGADSGVVGAKVVAAAPCLTVTPSSIDFGVGAFSGNGLVKLTAAPMHSVQSCSSTEETVTVRGTNALDSAGTLLWTLVTGNPCAGGTNRYAVSVQAPVNTVELLLSQNMAVGQLPAGDSWAVDAELTMPCAGGAGAGKELFMQIVYTASF